MQPPAGDEKSVQCEAAPVAMRGGPPGVVVDFDLLPDLLDNVAAGGRAETVAAWAVLLTAAGFEGDCK